MASEGEDALAIVCEFLEVAVHGILYARDIYPRGSFELRKKYGIPVQICVHPGVRSYVDALLESLSQLLQRREVNTFCVLILNANQEPVEKFMFEISTVCDNSFCCSDLLSLELELRDMLLKIYTCNSVLHPVLKECTWRAEVHLQQSAFVEFTEKGLLKSVIWTMDDQPHGPAVMTQIVPLKSINYGFLQLQLHIEEQHGNPPTPSE